MNVLISNTNAGDVMIKSPLTHEAVVANVENFLADQYKKRQSVARSRPRIRRWRYRYWRGQATKVALALACALLAVWLSYAVVWLCG